MAKPRSGLRWNWLANDKANLNDWALLVQKQETKEVSDFNIPAEMVLSSEIVAQKFHVLNLSSTSAPIAGWNHINLDITNSFHIPLSDDLKVAYFYNTNATASWDEKDLPKLNGTAAEAIAARLTGRIVLIGDSTQTFQQQGQTSLGPYVFRNPNGEVQITKTGTIFEVTPLQLQPLDTAITPDNGFPVVRYETNGIFEDRNHIAILDAGVTRMTIGGSVRDRVIQIAQGGPNAVPIVSATGQQFSGPSGVTTDSTFIVDVEYASAFLIGETNGWKWYLSGFGHENRNKIITTNAPTTAKPSDILFLNGNTDIFLDSFNAWDSFDIEWKANYSAKIICPAGYTIAGVNEDLDLDLANAAIKHIKLRLWPDNDFAVWAHGE